MKAISGYLLAAALGLAATTGGLATSMSGVAGLAEPTPPDVAISKTDGVTTAVAGGSVTYTITVTNGGAGDAVGATVSDTFPALLTVSGWTCVGAGGGTCTASGSGNINDTVTVPVGGAVTYTATATISASATGSVSNAATATAPNDSNPGNNTATDTDTIVQSDSDNDEVPDNLDNCPLAPNSNQLDTDVDGQGDACDPCPQDPTNQCEEPTDTDGDGLTDAKEETIGTNPQDPDTDNDGLHDGREWAYKATYTCLNLFRMDSDGEGIGDFTELNGVTVSQYFTTNADNPGVKYYIGKVRTNPCKQDTDGDGLTDWREVVGSAINQQVVRFVRDGGVYQLTSRKTNPLKRDTDGDSLSDKLEITGAANWRFDHRRSDPTTADTDWGGGKDGREVLYHHTDPTWAGH